MNQRAQGALEYLMLIAAAVVVVAIVISFIGSAIGPVQSAGSQQQYDYICKTLNTNSYLCGCYLCDATKEGKDEETNTNGPPTQEGCHYLATKLKEPLLEGCATLPSRYD
jgi:hypothetical protein